MKKIIIIGLVVVLAIAGVATFLIVNKGNKNKDVGDSQNSSSTIDLDSSSDTDSEPDESSKIDESSSELDTSSDDDSSLKTDDSSKTDNSSEVEDSSETDESSKNDTESNPVQTSPVSQGTAYEPSFDDKHFYTGTMTKEEAIKDYPFEESGSPYGTFYNTGVDLTMEGSTEGVIKKEDDELGAIQSFSQYGFFSEDRKIFFGVYFDGGWSSGTHDPTKICEKTGFYEGGDKTAQAVSAYYDSTSQAPDEINLSVLFANKTFKNIELTFDNYYLLKKEGETEASSVGRRNKGILSKTNGKFYNFEGYDFLIKENTNAYHIIAVDMSEEQNQPISKELEKVLFSICG